MATQRVIVAKIAGDAAKTLIKRFNAWPTYDPRGDGDPIICRELDRFVRSLRKNATVPPVVYFTEWIDAWSMGNILPGLGNESARVIVGNRFEAAVHQSPINFPKHTINGALTQECKWLRARLREAEDAWEPLTGKSVIVVIREPLAGCLLDEELEASLREVPSWLKG